MRAVTRRDVYESMAFNALVHYRIKEDAIPTIARVVRAEDAHSWTIRLDEHTTHVGDKGELRSAHRDNLADAFEVAAEVVVFARADGSKTSGDGVTRGIVRRVDTTTWPPEYVVERTDDDGAKGEIRAVGAQLALAKAYNDATRAIERDRAMEEADLIAKELMEEERREREAAERAAKKKLAKKKNRSASDVSSVSAVVIEEDDRTSADEAKAREEQERVAAEKAAAKAAARARQEEIKAEKLAKEKAAKKEAQKARKAAQKDKEASMSLVTSVGATANKSSAHEEEVKVAATPAASSEEGRDDEKEKTSDVGEDASPLEAPMMTETQRRKLEKERRKEQRLAEIDAYLKAQEIVGDDDESGAGAMGAAGAANKTKKRKKKKASNGSATKEGDLKVAANSEWFAAFAVLSFFALAGAIYFVFVNSYSVLRATTATFS